MHFPIVTLVFPEDSIDPPRRITGAMILRLTGVNGPRKRRLAAKGGSSNTGITALLVRLLRLS